MRTKILLLLLLCTSHNVELSAQGTWSQKTGLTFGWLVINTTAFSIGNKGYVGTGRDEQSGSSSQGTKAFWEYNTTTDTWTQLADFGGHARMDASSFATTTKGYLGVGVNLPSNEYFRDFWEYNPSNNTWTQIANFPGAAISGGVGFSINNKGYVGTGIDSSFLSHNEFYEYNPSTNSWTQKASLDTFGRSMAVGFASATNGYVGLGWDLYQNQYPKDLWKFDPAANTWTKLPEIDSNRINGIGFSINNQIYIGCGRTILGLNGPNPKSDLFRFNQSTNTWVTTASPNVKRLNGITFIANNKAYMGFGWDGVFGLLRDLWAFTPSASVISSFEESFMSIYPNPCKRDINVELKSITQSPISINLINMEGKIIFQQKISKASMQKTIHIQFPRTIQPGYYSLQLNSNEFQTSKGIMIEN